MRSYRKLSPRKAGATLGALALGGALLAAAAPAQAASPSAPASLPAPTGDGAKAICKRLPKTQAHLQKALTRLNGPVTEAGSVARLEQRVDNAKTAGQTAIYTYLNDRLSYRKSLIPTLTTRQNDLNAVAGWCSAQGLGSSPAAQ
ncbi:hypothetical protein [Kitasatospora sp. LaBMicrA B282]|uniref:hypothetical protein n=1 Tax=Kitasatospora sp. LaBMicrA B282 TaxID=3420949 RepID=UPI003D0AFB20